MFRLATIDSSGTGGLLTNHCDPVSPLSSELFQMKMSERRGLGSVLGDLLTNDFPAWTLSLNVSYPLGTSSQQATLTRTRLQRTKSEAQLKNQELQVVTQVRQAARQVLTNQQRVQTTRASRELNERRLEAEQRKFAAGTSTNFLVFQAQRDLSLARNNELRAVLDYNQAVVDFETVQEVPLNGGGGVGPVSTQPSFVAGPTSLRSSSYGGPP